MNRLGPSNIDEEESIYGKNIFDFSDLLLSKTAGIRRRSVADIRRT